jgi:hypothetical protein
MKGCIAYFKGYFVSGLNPTSCAQKQTQHFGNVMCCHPEMKYNVHNKNFGNIHEALKVKMKEKCPFTTKNQANNPNHTHIFRINLKLT